MTRVWVALGLLASIIVLAIAEFNLAVNTSDELLKVLDKAEVSAKLSSDQAEEFCGEMEEIWNSRKKRLAMFLSHDEIDEIGTSIESLKRLSQREKYDDFYIECGTLSEHIESLKETEIVNLQNFL